MSVSLYPSHQYTARKETHLELVELCGLLNLKEDLVSVGRNDLDVQRIGV